MTKTDGQPGQPEPVTIDDGPLAAVTGGGYVLLNALPKGPDIRGPDGKLYGTSAEYHAVSSR